MLAIPTDLLATQQLPQRVLGDVQKNEMDYREAIQKKRNLRTVRKWTRRCLRRQVLTQLKVNAFDCLSKFPI